MKIFYMLMLMVVSVMAQKVEFQVLGSGGPEIDGRASTSYIVWIDDKARVLIDAGSGSMLNFEKSKARLEDLEVIVLTHLHIDHSVDLPSYIKAGYFSNRRDILPIVGPSGNRSFPDIEDFLDSLFNGAYKYMSDVLDEDSDSFQIVPVEVDSKNLIHKKFKHFSLDLTNVYHGNVPAIAVRVNVGSKSLLVSGDTNNKNLSLEKLVKNVNLFVAHHAIPQYAKGYATQLHMTPSIIAKVAKDGNAKKVLLTHRMKRTIGKEEESLKVIKKIYNGEVLLAEDMMKLKL